MKMKRWLTNGMAAISLVICLALCVLWARGYWRSDALRFAKVVKKGEQPWRVRTLLIYCGKGCVEVGVGRDAYYLPGSGAAEEWRFYHAEDQPKHPSAGSGVVSKFAGFGMIEEENGGPPLWSVPLMKKLMLTSRQSYWTEKFRGIWAPYWFLVLVFGAMPGRRIYQWQENRTRRKRGLCEVCGYDLRESSDACPECGKLKPPSHESRANSASASAS
jgi:hypothetical protein